MIFKIQDLDKTFNQNKIFLFHGANDGHKDEVLKEKFELSFNGNIFIYYEKEVLSNLDNFYNDILSKSFFEKDKLIIIKEASDKLKSEIESIKEKDLGEIKIVLVSNILDKRSKLRNFFEKEKKLVSIAFYTDNNQTLNSITKSFFSKKFKSLKNL